MNFTISPEKIVMDSNECSFLLTLFQFSAKFPKFEETSDTSIDFNVVNDEMKLRNLENMYKKHGKHHYLNKIDFWF